MRVCAMNATAVSRTVATKNGRASSVARIEELRTQLDRGLFPRGTRADIRMEKLDIRTKSSRRACARQAGV